MDNSWENKNDTLTKDFQFKGFNEAVKFVNNIAKEANKLDHHPDILIHDYKHVKITLTTHCEGSKVTDKDHVLAKIIDGLA